jgi:hypothetical protein
MRQSRRCGMDGLISTSDEIEECVGPAGLFMKMKTKRTYISSVSL